MSWLRPVDRLFDARRDLQPVIQGFDNVDLKDAKALLDELSN